MFETFRSFFDPPITADPEQSTAKLAWVVRLRWVAIAAQLLSIIPALEFEVLEPTMLPLFLAVVATLAFLNIGTWIGLRGGTKGSPGHLMIQLGADILGLSALLILTGVELAPGQTCSFQVSLGIPLDLGSATFTNSESKTLSRVSWASTQAQLHPMPNTAIATCSPCPVKRKSEPVSALIADSTSLAVRSATPKYGLAFCGIKHV